MTPEEQFCGECGAPRPRLPARFEETEKQFVALKARRDAGQLTDADYESALRVLVVQDEAGTYWMLGTESGKWYRYNGQEWVGADPPVEAAEPSQKNTNVAVAAGHPAKRLQPWAWIAVGLPAL
jgi:hypothetical protein